MGNDDERPKGKIIDITGLLKRRKADLKPGSGPFGTKADGNEIPPPPPARLTVLPSMRMPKGRGTLAKAAERIAPIIEVKKHHAVRRLTLLLPAWMTPNVVTVFRTLFVVPMLACIRYESYWWAIGIFLAAAFLDFLDGAIAEARDMKTAVGAVLDATGDKIVVYAALIGMFDRLPHPLTVWAGTLIGFGGTIAFALTAIRLGKLWMKRDAPSDVAANFAGKTKLVTETVGVTLCMMGAALSAAALPAVGLAMLTIALVLAFISLLGHMQ